MRRDLHMMERICYRGRQKLGNAQAPQLEAVMNILIVISDRRVR